MVFRSYSNDCKCEHMKAWLDAALRIAGCGEGGRAQARRLHAHRHCGLKGARRTTRLQPGCTLQMVAGPGVEPRADSISRAAQCSSHGSAPPNLNCLEFAKKETTTYVSQ